MFERTPTLHDIAREVGVSVMTVSRALRNAPRVAPETRARVQAVAAALGYEPDPDLARLMHRVRSRKTVRFRAVIAVIREEVPQDNLLGPSYQYVPIEAIRQRALGHGYAVEEFWLGREGLTPKRLQKILLARGIEGVIVSPQSLQLPCSKLDYSPFASVAFGYAMREPALHMCAGNMTLGIQTAAEQLTARGYHRIGVAVTQWIVNRSQFGYSGGFFHFQQSLPAEDRIPLLLLPHNRIERGFAAFSKWMNENRPDVLISFDTHVPEWLTRLGLRVPDDIGFVVHDWTPAMTSCAGIYQRRDHLAAAAVDLIVTQLSQHERGVPAVARQIMIPPQWINGPSVRKK
ncbi:MAG: LacI family transcriptional regulator [Verrucomicrobiales bacterium]|jgi:DNA-binding LacI/PurR family transcriptional regulator|nr:LacI family transcriptional regulator [Verrucomicrobiales bacterium]MDP4792541.1 LacI family transcriptional regulator [Verrucomicrobiales bacterium]MDP4938737.1 LacI family transcriptional regulator [Verrucomicrobiales bacterium]MDP5004478.1 LacI family transcriptional regulator [Verrucomicrobiales bacterium]